MSESTVAPIRTGLVDITNPEELQKANPFIGANAEETLENLGAFLELATDMNFIWRNEDIQAGERTYYGW
jgi:hypothetical protein